MAYRSWDEWNRTYERLLNRKIAVEEDIEEVESELSVMQSELDELMEAAQQIKKLQAEIAKEKARLKKLESIWNDLDKQDKRMVNQEPEK